MLFDVDLDDGSQGGGRRSPVNALRDHWVRLLGLALLAVVVTGVVWIVVTGLLARSRLDTAQAQIQALRTDVVSGNAGAAASHLHDIESNVADAQSLTTGPAWWTAANLPFVGSPVQTARVIAAQAHTLSRTALIGLPALTSQFAKPRSGQAGRVDLSALQQATPTLANASVAAARAVGHIRASDGSWLPMVSSARQRALRAFTRLEGELRGADRAANILVPMLGQHTTKRYFIGFLNEAESRPIGGIPGAFAIATVTDGRVKMQQFGSDDDLSGVHANVDLGAAYAARYGQDQPTRVFQNSDISPDFRDAARIWAGMWQAKTGQHIDGALAIDPTALSYALHATGGAKLPGGGQVTDRNVVQLTQQTQYTRYPGNSSRERTARKQYLDDIARAISNKLIKADNIRGIVKAMVRSAGERRLDVWSADAPVEAQLVAANWAGVLGSSDGSTYSGFTFTNAAGSKLDYYLERSVSYQRFACSAGATATATLTLENDAPRTGLPHYVTVRGDKPKGAVRPGDNKLLVTYYAGQGAKIVAMTLDGARQTVVTQPEGNTTAATIAVELPVRRTRTLTVSIREPATSRAVQVLSQPGVRAARVHIDDCH